MINNNITKIILYNIIYLILSSVFHTAYGDEFVNIDYITDFKIENNLNNLTAIEKNIIGKQLLSKNKQGSQIIITKKIDISKNDDLPVVWLTMQSNYRKWQVIYKQNSYMVITNLESGNTEVVTALPTKKRDPRSIQQSSTGEPPDEKQNSHGATVKTINIRDISSLTWASGRYAFTLLTYDWRSNTEIIELSSKNPKEISELANLSNRINHHQLSTIANKHGVITFNIIDTASNQITVSLPSKITKQKEKLSGLISVPLTESNFYSTVSQENKSKDTYFALTIVFTQLDNFRPYTFNIKIPIEDATQLVGKTMQLGFELDMNSFFEDSDTKPKQIAQVYVINGSNITGPQALVVE